MAGSTQEDAGNRRVRFEPIISLGNLITLIAIIGAGVAWSQNIATNQASLLQRVKDDEQTMAQINTDLHFQLQQAVESQRSSLDRVDGEVGSLDRKISSLIDRLPLVLRPAK